jgi:hypothetical protein
VLTEAGSKRRAALHIVKGERRCLCSTAKASSRWMPTSSLSRQHSPEAVTR